MQDPSESTNLASQHPGLVRELLAEAEAALGDAPLQVVLVVWGRVRENKKCPLRYFFD